MKKQIFVIDDEKDIREILSINLSKEGYEVKAFSSAEEASRGLTHSSPDLIVLDIMMPGMDGYEFCRELRSSEAFRSIPIIFLSARAEEFDRVLGLELGGDDYVTKPFSIKELRSRVKAVLRRSGNITDSVISGKKLKYRGIELFPDSFVLRVDDEEVDLTKTEFGILELFLRNPGKIFTRDNIIDSIRGQNVYVVDRTIDVHVMNLRKKLGRYKNSIKTFSGVGYGIKE